VLSKGTLAGMRNCDADVILHADDPINELNRLAHEYDRDAQAIVQAIQDGGALPAPIVLKDSKGYYLLAGNTRIMSALALGKNIPVSIVSVGV
jgi:ParB-like chromosome segregation protein Spo0J